MTLIVLCVPVSVSGQMTQTMSVRARTLGDTSGIGRAIATQLQQLASRDPVVWSRALTDSVLDLSSQLKLWNCTQKLHTVNFIGSTEEAQCLWSKAGTGSFNVAQLGVATDRGSIYAELLSTTFGTLRASLGTMVAATESSELSPEETVQRLVAGGGTLVLGLQRPAHVFLSGGNRTLSVVSAAARLAADFEALGAEVSSPAVNGALSADWQMAVRSDDDALELFGEFHFELLHGSAEFYRALQLDPKNYLFYTRASIGATVWGGFVITWSRVLGGSDPIGDIGGQITVTARRQGS